MRTLSHSWLWTEPRVTPRSRISPAAGGISRLGSTCATDPTDRYGLTQGSPLLPPSNDCHQPLVEAAKVEQRLERCFFFFSNEGIG